MAILLKQEIDRKPRSDAKKVERRVLVVDVDSEVIRILEVNLAHVNPAVITARGGGWIGILPSFTRVAGW